MAPSRSQVVTLCAGSAILFGVAFTIYLVKKKRQFGKKNEAKQETGENVTQITTVAQALSTDAAEESDSGLLLEPGSPLPDREGMTVSSSWAILNTNCDTNSPHLSPVSTDEEGDENNSMSMFADDSTQNATVLESSVSDSTLLQDKDPETISIEEMTIQYEELLREHSKSGNQTFTTEEIKAALIATQNPSKGLTERNAEVLVWLLSHPDIKLRHTAVMGIANAATFTINQNALREKGCLVRLAKLLEIQRMSLWLRHPNAASAISSTLNAVINLSINEQNNKEMEACVPMLIDISLDRETGEAVCLSSLQALTNLSVTSSHHPHYTRMVQRLYELLASYNNALRLQALKILINLSCNPDMVPHLLAAKAPEGLLELLQPSTSSDAVILRLTTLLANIMHVVKDQNIQSSSLPTDDKAASPETMYTALLGIGNLANLKNKVFLLCKYPNEDIRAQATRVFNHLK